VLVDPKKPLKSRGKICKIYIMKKIIVGAALLAAIASPFNSLAQETVDGGTLPNVTLSCWETMRRPFNINVGLSFFVEVSASINFFDIVSYSCNNGDSGIYLDY